MTQCSALSVRQFFARAILRIDGDQSPTETVSLAWTLRNLAEDRMEAGSGPMEVDLARAQHLCRRLFADLGMTPPGDEARANGNGADAGAFEDEAGFNRALACVSMVWDGVLPDPTNGATRVHRHDRQPEWSQDCEATALIGSMLFFRAESADTSG